MGLSIVHGSQGEQWSGWDDFERDVYVVRRDRDNVRVEFPAGVVMQLHQRLGHSGFRDVLAEAERKLTQFEQRTQRAVAPGSRFLAVEGEWFGE